MSKVGILVHPFWMYHNGDAHLAEYKEILESNKYESLYIYLPFMNEKTRREMFELKYFSIITYYTGVHEQIASGSQLEEITDSMSSLLNNDKSYAFTINRLIMRWLKAKEIRLPRDNKALNLCKILLDCRDEILKNISDHYLQYIFYGDLSNCPTRTRLILDLLATKTDTKLSILYYGGVESSHYLTDMNFIDENMRRDMFRYDADKVDIFGEYLNKCVLSVARNLKPVGINVNIIKDKSIYYGRTLSKEKNIVYNRLNRYMAVYNPPIEDKKDGMVLSEEKYFGKIKQGE